MLKSSGKRLGNAWAALTAVLMLHVIEEIVRDFFDLYLKTMLAVHARWPSLPLPLFMESSWIVTLAMVILFLWLLVPFAYRDQGPIRLYAKVFAVAMLANALAHLSGSIVLHRLLPGFYSSPLLVLFALLLLFRASESA